MFFQNFSWRDPKPIRAARAEAEPAQSAGRRECAPKQCPGNAQRPWSEIEIDEVCERPGEADHKLSFAEIDTDMRLYHHRMSPLAGDENALPTTETSSGRLRIPAYIRSQAAASQITRSK
jgi:hypothetical protein